MKLCKDCRWSGPSAEYEADLKCERPEPVFGKTHLDLYCSVERARGACGSTGIFYDPVAKPMEFEEVLVPNRIPWSWRKRC